MANERQFVTREELHQELAETLDRFRASLLADIRALILAAYDDEPYTEQQRREDAEAIAALDRGQGITTEQLNRELGL
jgi:hypothetical protein